MTGTALVSPGKTVVTTKTAVTTITTFSHTVAPVVVPASIHDCTDPSQASVANCIWPSNYVSPVGLKYGMASPVGLVAQNGLVVQTTGTATIGWS